MRSVNVAYITYEFLGRKCLGEIQISDKEVEAGTIMIAVCNNNRVYRTTPYSFGDEQIGNIIIGSSFLIISIIIYIMPKIIQILKSKKE